MSDYNDNNNSMPEQPTGYNQQQPTGYDQQATGYNQQPTGYNQQPTGYNSQPEFEMPPQQVAYQQSQYSQPMNSLPPKKSKKKLVGALVAVVGVAAVACVAVFAGPKIIDAISGKAKLAPLDRFKSAIESASTNVTGKLETAKENDNPIVTGNFDLDSDFTITIGDSAMQLIGPQYNGLKNINGNLDIISYNSQMYANASFGTPSGTAASIEAYIDPNAGTLAARVPELGDAYFGTSFDPSEFNSALSSASVPTVDVDKIAALVESEYKTFLDDIKDVQISEDVTVTASDVSAKYDKLTTTLDAKEFGEITYNCFKRLVEEPAFIELYESYAAKYGDEDVSTAMDELLAEVKDWADSNDTGITIDLYVDDDDKIVGMVFSPADNDVNASFGLLTAKKGSTGFEIFAKEDDEDLFKCYGSFKESKGAYTGDATLEFFEDGVSSFSITADYDKLCITNSKRSGSITISSPKLMGAAFKITMDATNEKGTATLSVTMSGVSLADFTYNFTLKASDSCPSLPGDAEICDVQNDPNSYANSIDVYGFMDNFQSVTGIDISSLVSDFVY